MIKNKRRLVAGIIDYGVGNIASLRATFDAIGIRSKHSSNRRELDTADFFVLPGVGAFPYAMNSLTHNELGSYLQIQAKSGKAILGVCLGMQLLMDESEELRLTRGLGLIPGRVALLDHAKAHVGWNTIDILDLSESPIKMCHGEAVYFNHSYACMVDEKYQMATSQITLSKKPFTVAIRKDNIVGLQFHPEKSQLAGRRILSALIEGVFHA